MSNKEQYILDNPIETKDRQHKILEMIREDGAVTVKKLKETFIVSEVTLRSDLRFLQTQGHVQRYHGGATLITQKEPAGTLILERQINLQEKDSIGKFAANLIENGDSIILDSGTTTTAIADHIGHLHKLSVITTGINIALKLCGKPDVNILISGGFFKFPTLSTSGEQATKFFENIRAQKLFLATAGICPNLGLSFPSESDIRLKMAMINSAQSVYVVADSSKINLISLFALPCTWSQIHYLITDDKIKSEDKQKFEALGVQVLISNTSSKGICE